MTNKTIYPAFSQERINGLYLLADFSLKMMGHQKEGSANYKAFEKDYNKAMRKIVRMEKWNSVERIVYS